MQQHISEKDLSGSAGGYFAIAVCFADNRVWEIDGKTFTASLEDNAAARELLEILRQAPVSLDMRDYSGFEKVGSLGQSLTTDNRQITTGAGDIVLYNGDNIVMFYGSNSWSYTRLGHIDDLTGWEEALGSGRITAVFSIP